LVMERPYFGHTTQTNLHRICPPAVTCNFSTQSSHTTKHRTQHPPPLHRTHNQCNMWSSTTFDLAQYPTEETIKALAFLLERMTRANDQLNSNPRRSSYTRFHARSIPSVDIQCYLTRIAKYCPCQNESFLSLLVYFDRMSKNTLSLTGKPFKIDSYNIHRLIIAGITVASKYFDDVFYTNSRYAKVGGLPVSELNSLELEFLVINKFSLNISIPELQRYGDHLLKLNRMDQEYRNGGSLYENPRYRPKAMSMDGLVEQTQKLHVTKRLPRMASNPSLNMQYFHRSSVNARPVSTSTNEEEDPVPTRRLSFSATPFVPMNGGIPTPPPSISPVSQRATYTPPSFYDMSDQSKPSLNRWHSFHNLSHLYKEQD
jgi:hypothetical protein